MVCLLPISFVIQLFHAYRKLCAHILCCLSKIACIMSFWTDPLTLLVVCSVSFSCTVTLVKHKHVYRKYNFNHTYIEPRYMWQVICIIPSTVIFVCRACVNSISTRFRSTNTGGKFLGILGGKKLHDWMSAIELTYLYIWKSRGRF